MRPRGKPPTPSARSTAIEPVEMTSIFSSAAAPSFMIEPFPTCFSIGRIAWSIARAFSDTATSHLLIAPQKERRRLASHRRHQFRWGVLGGRSPPDLTSSLFPCVWASRSRRSSAGPAARRTSCAAPSRAVPSTSSWLSCPWPRLDPSASLPSRAPRWKRAGQVEHSRRASALADFGEGERPYPPHDAGPPPRVRARHDARRRSRRHIALRQGTRPQDRPARGGARRPRRGAGGARHRTGRRAATAGEDPARPAARPLSRDGRGRDAAARPRTASRAARRRRGRRSREARRGAQAEEADRGPVRGPRRRPAVGDARPCADDRASRRAAGRGMRRRGLLLRRGPAPLAQPALRSSLRARPIGRADGAPGEGKRGSRAPSPTVTAPRDWLARLPGGAARFESIAAPVAADRGLVVGPRIAAGPHSHVAPAGPDAILKIIPVGDDDADHIADALRFWDGDGAVRLLRHDPTWRVLLVERAVPGTEAAQAPEGEALAAAIDVGKRIWRAPDAPHPYRSVRDWVRRWLPPDERHPLVPAARRTFEAMDLRTDTLVHADFHHHNLLRHGDRWVAIDPKPIVGEPEFDVPAFLWNPLGTTSTRARTERRIRAFADAGLDAERIRRWAIVRGVCDGLPLHPPEDETTRAQLRIVRELL